VSNNIIRGVWYNMPPIAIAARKGEMVVVSKIDIIE